MQANPNKPSSSGQASHDQNVLTLSNTTTIDRLLNVPTDDVWEEATTRLKTTLNAQEYREVLMVRSLDQLLDAFAKKRASLRSRRLHRYVSKTTPYIAHLQTFTGVVNSLAQASSSATLIWGSLKLVLEVAARTQKVIDRVDDMLETVTAEIPRYQDYIAYCPTAPRLRSAILGIYLQIIQLNCSLISHLRQNPLVALFRSATLKFESQFSQILDTVQKLQRSTEAEAQVAFYISNRSALDQILEMHESKNVSSNVSLPFCYIPYGENPRFYGRSDYIEQIAANLLPAKQARSQVSLVLNGLAGVGKTEIALHFVHEYIDSFPVVLWISAEKTERMLQAFVEIARRMGLKQSTTNSDPKVCMAAVHDWLASASVPWLLVFDNATDAVFNELKRSWPSGRSGSILVTTRSNEFSLRFSMTKSIDISPFESEEGINLMRLLLSEDPADHLLLDDDGALSKLVFLLGGLPLAISQIAGFMKASRSPCTETLQMYRNPEMANKLHTKPPLGSTSQYEETVATVWKIAIQNLSEDALAMLEAISFLDPDGIPQELLANMGTADSTSSPESEIWDFRIVVEELSSQNLIKVSRPELPSRNAAVETIVKSVAAVNPNVGAGSVTTQEGDSKSIANLVSVHRLVQAQSLQTDTDRRANAFKNAQDLLLKLGAKSGLTGGADLTCNWELYEILMPHILSLESKSRKTGADLPPPESLHEVLAYALIFLHARGSYNTANVIFDTTEKVCRAKSHPLLLAYVYDAQGDNFRNSNFGKKAHEMYSKALDVLLKVEASDDRERQLARAYSTLGNSSLSLGNIETSLEYHAKAIELQERLALHREDQMFGNALALAYINASWAFWKNKNFREGSDMLAKAMRLIDELNQVRDKLWARRSWALRCLGNIRNDQGRHDEALQLHKEAFEIQVEHFGYLHHETGDLCYKLAKHYQRLKQNDEAIRYVRAALIVYDSVAAEVEVRAATARAKYYEHELLASVGQDKESRKAKEEAAHVRTDWAAIPAEVDDNLLAYELLVPYWGQ